MRLVVAIALIVGCSDPVVEPVITPVGSAPQSISVEQIPEHPPEPTPELQEPPPMMPAAVAQGQRRAWHTFRPGAAPDPGPQIVALLLAQLYVIESGFNSPVDRAIMIHVLDDRREAMSTWWHRPLSFWEALDRYSGGRLRTPERRRTGRLRYILELRPDDEQPPGWPERMSWARNAPRWRTILKEAEGHVAGRRPDDPCGGRAGHWGGAGTLATTTDAPQGTMRSIVCDPAQRLRTYSTQRTRDRS